MQVHTVQVDTTLAIKDIKAPIEAPYTFREALPWIIIFFAVLIIGYFVYYCLKKRKMAEPVFKAPSKPKLPPHQIALDALDNLRLKKLWQSGRIKDYHTELTDIIREYIFGKFNVHAMELTSDEINEAISSTPTNAGVKEKLRQTLLLADFVKFAKFQPTPLEHDASLNNVVDFVKETIHINGNIVEEELMEIPKSSESEQNKLTEADPISVDAIQISKRKEVNDV
ncbi:MAG: hypothetical protein K8R68_07735 [Bacteroidales bacterium]|nr:hypothetical protein [Bacteroidales bacterium]